LSKGGLVVNKLWGVFWEKIQGLFHHEEKRRVLSNFFFLSILQAANYLLPLITLPYLTRVLGPSYFGLLGVALSLVGYFNPITEFGFGLTATREISIAKNDHSKISEIFSAVMVLKILLTMLSLGILLLLLALIPQFGAHRWLYLATFGITVGNALYPSWFFQGMEEMQYITLMNITAKAIFTLLVFFVVRSSNDYLFVPILQSLGWIVAALVALVIVKRKFSPSFFIPSRKVLWYHLRESFPIFFSSLISSVYIISAPLFLSFFVAPEEVGYFYGATRLIDPLKSLLGPVSGALYPYLSQKAYYQKERFAFLVKRLSLIFGAGALVVSLGLFVFAGLIIRIVLGSQYGPSVLLFRILSFVFFFVALSTVWGVQTLLPLNKKKEFTFALTGGSVLFVLLSLVLLPWLKTVGMAMSLVTTEASVALFMFFALRDFLFSKEKEAKL